MHDSVYDLEKVDNLEDVEGVGGVEMYPSRSLDNYVLVPTQAMITGDYTFPHPDGGPATQWSSMEDRDPPIYVGIMELPACVKGVKALLKAARTVKDAGHAVTETAQACAGSKEDGARPDLNRIVDDLHQRHDEFDERGRKIIEHMAQMNRYDEFDERGREIMEHMVQGAANLARIEYMKFGKELAQGLDGKLLQIKARALNVYRGLSDGQNLGILVPMSELVSLDSGRMRREVEEMLQN
eukprot:gene28266-31371_t